MEKNAKKREAAAEAEYAKEREAWKESQAKLALEAPAGVQARSEDDDSPTPPTEPEPETPADESTSIQHMDGYQREEGSRMAEEEHPLIASYDQHDPDADHDAWLKEQQEIYRREHAHLFEEPEEPKEEPKDKP